MKEMRKIILNRIIAYVLIISTLVTPFLLISRYGNSLEPYPAVVLPAGAFKISFVGDSSRIFYKSLAGYALNGKLVSIPVAELLHPIPVHYAPGILASSFGLQGSTISHHTAGLIGWLKRRGIIRKREFSPQIYSNTKAWLQEKLLNLQLKQDSILIIHHSKVVYQGTDPVGLPDTLNIEYIKF